MAKRRHSHDEKLPFVALMDTMTNVVGVLIIVMVMIGIGIASSVQKILSDLPPATVEQLNDLLKQIAESAPKVDPLQVEEQIKKEEQELKKHIEELKTYDLTKNKQDAKLMDLDELRKRIDDGNKQRDTKKTEVEKLLAEMDKLKVQLDTTPVYRPPPATVVRLPSPRPMPENAVLQRFLVVDGRVYFLNDEEYMKVVLKQIDANLKGVTFSETRRKRCGWETSHDQGRR